MRGTACVILAIAFLSCGPDASGPDDVGAAEESWMLGLTGEEIVRRATRPPQKVFRFGDITVFRWGDSQYQCAYISTNDHCYQVRWYYGPGNEGMITEMKFREGWVENVRSKEDKP